jgi:two-component system, chemotaxis family, protein-glutamate methylesterase/glutaminase
MTTARDIIVIGASLGGLEALCKLAAYLPAPFPAAVLIVLHTAPQGPRMLAEIVGRFTPLPVSYGRQDEAVRPGHIYFASPDRHLIVTAQGQLVLDAGAKVRHARPAADPLFQSAAAVYGRRVIGVVLTGGDHDGTDGLRAIKAAGGLGIVQRPAEALAASMPRSALLGADPDYCVSLDEMGALLVKLVGGSAVGQLGTSWG